eukprot:COSAG06_NODE_5865_length_3239_cov_6.721019_3_plen_142_part_01
MASSAEVQAAAACTSLEEVLLTVRLERYIEPLQRAGLDLDALLRVQSKDELKRYGLKLAPAAKLFGVAQTMRAARERDMQRGFDASGAAATGAEKSSLATLLFESKPRTPADFQKTIKKGMEKSWAELTQEERFAARRLGWK